MKMKLITIALLAFVVSAFAIDEYFWASVELKRDELKSLERAGIIIDNYINGNAIVYVTEQDLARIASLGYSASVIPKATELGRRLYPGLLDGYHTYSQLTTTMHSYPSSYPSLCKLDSLGPTPLGNWIWVLKISDNVAVREPEPQFRYMSTIHGDEPVGMEMCLNLIQYLLSNYPSDTFVARLVENCEIYIAPLINPDGYVNRQRTNSHGVDLNRNYPVPDGTVGDDGTFTIEPENEGIINYSLPRNFVLSANFHTGATVVNYPWDYTPTRAPDDSLLKIISLEYSSRNSLMWSSTVFPHGITNGYDWYEVNGSLQDWAYNRGEIDLTIELYDVKWPDASLLPAIWNYNRESMLALMSWALRGVYGTVTDSLTGEPIKATITMNIPGQTIVSDSVTGFYQRIIYPGNYTLNFSAFGYLPRSISVSVPAGGSTRQDIKLYPLGSCFVSGYVDLAGRAQDAGAIVICANDSMRLYDTTDATGYFEFPRVPATGEWHITATADSFADSTITVNLASLTRFIANFTLYPYLVFYASDFESDNGGLAVFSGSDWEWGHPTYGPASAHSGNKLWATKLSTNYSNNSNSILETPEINLPAWSRPLLKIWHWYSFEFSGSTGRYYDGGNVKLSVDGAAFFVIEPDSGYNCTIYSSNPYLGGERAFGGSSSGWRSVSFDLSAYAGHRVKIRFHFGSDANTRYPGWYIDDIAVLSPNYILLAERKEKMTESFAGVSAYPNPTNGVVHLKLKGAEKKGEFTLEAFNILGERVYSRLETAKDDIIWNFRDNSGNELPGGIYLIRISYNGLGLSTTVLYIK